MSRQKLTLKHVNARYFIYQDLYKHIYNKLCFYVKFYICLLYYSNLTKDGRREYTSPADDLEKSYIHITVTLMVKIEL